ncbi:hypothetical protein LWE61_16040 [Sphingobium sufflavum]|uniref:DUF2946 family protein n=1 Tax=Sphingobium sufflavum TaxID=1129547 RepID=UPI001F1CEAD3|nr:DUF2946 family protein [Sphingobium sufflavum]MCE7798058.1 hypothetical protein [Sphingobium sufflavum]
MSVFRALIRDHRSLALIVAMLALCVKFVVPQGYMFAPTMTKFLTVQLCFDGIEHRTTTIAIPIDAKKSQGHHDDGGKPDGKCAFTALGMGALGGADAPLLAIALAFILALGFAPIRPVVPDRSSYLRPPLRGPPALN